MKTEIKVGNACNNNCTFCLNSDRTLYKNKEQVFREIDEAKQKEIRQIQFTGGEISIRPDFFNILRHAKECGLEIVIHTNGRTFSYTSFTEKVCSKGIEMFLVSLHTHNEELNKKLTSVQGGYEQTIKGIKNIKKMGCKVVLNTVISRDNIEWMEKIIEHNCKLEVDAIQISWCRGEGKVEKDLSMIPKFTENIEKLKKSIKITEKESVRLSTIGIPLCILNENKKYSGRPYRSSYIIREGKISYSEDIAKQKKAITLPACNICKLKNVCCGVPKKYFQQYGGSEFKPVI